MIVPFVILSRRIFITCFTRVLQRLWDMITCWYNRKVNVDLDMETIFLGSDELLTHTVIMTAKQYIFSCKCLEKLPSFIGFYSCLMHVRKLELYSATLYFKQHYARIVDTYRDRHVNVCM